MSIEQTFDNMRGIVEREMIVHGVYAGWRVSSTELLEAGTICGGRKYCAIGTMIISSGVPAYADPGDDFAERTMEFSDVLAAYHANELEGDIAVVLQALNDASNEYMDTHQRHGREWSRRVEHYGADTKHGNRAFEGFFEDNDPGREALLWVIDRAKELATRVTA